MLVYAEFSEHCSRGPGFLMGPDTGFGMLPGASLEPTDAEMATLVDEVYDATTSGEL